MTSANHLAVVLPVESRRAKVDETDLCAFDLSHVFPLSCVVGNLPIGRGEENVLRFQVSMCKSEQKKSRLPSLMNSSQTERSEAPFLFPRDL